MSHYYFLDDKGTFCLDQPQEVGALYFPIAGENGMKGVVTPKLGGDLKLSQNEFILQPVSEYELHNNKSTRNFWLHFGEGRCLSVTGASAAEEAKCFGSAAGCKPNHMKLTAGPMWQTVHMKSEEFEIEADVTSFVPLLDEKTEVMYVELFNKSAKEISFVPTAAVPLYGRSADNLRDHRHVTSLLHRIHTRPEGVVVKPTLSFDERGHRKNSLSYFVCALEGEGVLPEGFCPVAEDFIGEGGSLAAPRSVYEETHYDRAGEEYYGFEAMGAIRFGKRTLQPGERISYTVLIGAAEGEEEIDRTLRALSGEREVENALYEVKQYWDEKINVACRTSDADFDNFMRWVSFQPMLRRIYGCSFLPHHDYGKGGRGWRDLWQDCLALLIMNPDGVREMLLSNYGGVRMDGTNATIIGAKQGEFIADRNNITRVWMDHGLWPLMTTRLYIDQTGDLDILLKEATYFKDKQEVRGTETDAAYQEGGEPVLKDRLGNVYRGSILEHILVQNLSVFYETGAHNHMRLRGADWNDALDMAAENGESVAFTAAYAGNLHTLAELVKALREERNLKTVEVAQELLTLLGTFKVDGGTDDDKEKRTALYEDTHKKQALLEAYCKLCYPTVSGQKVRISLEILEKNLREKAEWVKEHIRRTEWLEHDGYGWFNSYYDNRMERVEGMFDGKARMMLTGQVFTVMSGTAEAEQTEMIIRAADNFLYQEKVGGYRLNTDFEEVRMDLGRMFGFAYGHKENGAVFSHMTTMYANALYERNFVKEGYKALHTLYRQAADFETSRIYPGIPEYFNSRGRGMYHYLTGAASWYMLTVVTQMFGTKGRLGDLHFEPKLMPEQFDSEGNAQIYFCFGGRKWHVTYHRKAQDEKAGSRGKDRIERLVWNGIGREHFYIMKQEIEVQPEEILQEVIVYLSREE